jgi:hypothetical protein
LLAWLIYTVSTPKSELKPYPILKIQAPAGSGKSVLSGKLIRELLSKPVWQMTGEEFILLNRHALQEREARAAQPAADTEKKYVYGIGGIARLFGCSMPTANRIKKSGKIDRAITQIGRKIIVDADMALELAGHKSGGRR